MLSGRYDWTTNTLFFVTISHLTRVNHTGSTPLWCDNQLTIDVNVIFGYACILFLNFVCHMAHLSKLYSLSKVVSLFFPWCVLLNASFTCIISPKHPIQSQFWLWPNSERIGEFFNLESSVEFVCCIARPNGVSQRKAWCLLKRP